MTCEADATNPPAVCQQHAKGVLPHLQEGGQVVDLIIEQTFVGCRFGGEAAGIHPLTVEPQGVHAVGAGVESGAFGQLVQCEATAQLLRGAQAAMTAEMVRHGDELLKEENVPLGDGGLLLGLDPLSLPRLPHHAAAEGHGRLCRHALTADFSDDGIGGFALQRKCGRIVGLPRQCAAVPAEGITLHEAKAHGLRRALHPQREVQRIGVSKGDVGLSVDFQMCNGKRVHGIVPPLNDVSCNPKGMCRRPCGRCGRSGPPSRSPLHRRSR